MPTEQDRGQPSAMARRLLSVGPDVERRKEPSDEIIRLQHLGRPRVRGRRTGAPGRGAPAVRRGAQGARADAGARGTRGVGVPAGPQRPALDLGGHPGRRPRVAACAGAGALRDHRPASPALPVIGPLAVAVLLAAAHAGGEVRPELGTAARQQTLRALAAYLDDTSQGLLEGASDSLLRGMTSEARFVSSIRAFARSARDLRTDIDGYAGAPFDVDARVAALADVAGALDERLRAADVLGGTRAEWDAVRDVMARMRALLSGADVEVPDAYVVPALSGERLDRFRALAASVEADAAEGHALARASAGRYPSRGTQFVGELG